MIEVLQLFNSDQLFNVSSIRPDCCIHLTTLLVCLFVGGGFLLTYGSKGYDRVIVVSLTVCVWGGEEPQVTLFPVLCVRNYFKISIIHNCQCISGLGERI